MTAYTAKQMADIGGKDWIGHNGTHRVYLNADLWAPMIGLNYETYKTGNISHAAINGVKISNSQAHRLLAGKVYWQDGRVVISGDVIARYADTIRAGIAAKVAEMTRPVAPADIIATLRAAGRTAREIAAAVGVHVSTVYRWARARFRPTAARAAALAALAA